MHHHRLLREGHCHFQIGQYHCSEAVPPAGTTIVKLVVTTEGRAPLNTASSNEFVQIRLPS